MKELSLNILDIAENSVKAKAKLIEILLTWENDTLRLKITDDGCGMTADILKRVSDPFYTTRTTRSVGMGISLLKLAAEQTGGYLTIDSVSELDCPDQHGTTLEALFYPDHIDSEPLGDIISTLITLIQGSPDIDFHYLDSSPERQVELDTRQIRETLGGDIPLNSFEVLEWIRGYLEEQYAQAE